MDLTLIIIIVFIICLTLILQTPLKNYNLKFTWIIKIIAVYIAFLLLFVYMFINNDLINKHLPPIILIINIIIIVILLLEEFSPNNYLKNISLLSFIFLLLTFDYKRFEMKKGILINPDTKWIVSYAIVLSFWFLIADNKNIESNWIRYTLIILILIPFIFPIKYYGFFRILFLALACSIGRRTAHLRHIYRL